MEVVDFGEAASGATRRIFVQVRANAPSTLSIKSEGGVHRVEEAENATVVPYAVELDGETIDFSAARQGKFIPRALWLESQCR